MQGGPQLTTGHPAVEVSYTTTVDDYIAFSVHMWRKSKVGRGIYLMSWLLPVIGLLGAAALVTHPNNHRWVTCYGLCSPCCILSNSARVTARLRPFAMRAC
jgi:hypothetical protein